MTATDRYGWPDEDHNCTALACRNGRQRIWAASYSLLDARLLDREVDAGDGDGVARVAVDHLRWHERGSAVMIGG